MPDLEWTPTRAEALRRLDDFNPRSGRDYAETRNSDLGPLDRSNVSVLSPYLRHRLILEEEVAAAAIGRHGARGAEKFLQEVCWRTYWKGWLELRPGVWGSYRREVKALLDDPKLVARVEAATSGRSGIACFDAWAKELVDVGYLHNHARMWFASLWIFTLDLPWAMGADFFMRHLLDGDPASNTLSWRWVAGLQTRGKTYLATAENIARFTNGRFRPRERFADDPGSVKPPDFPPVSQLKPSGRPGAGAAGLLLTEDDLVPESLGLPAGSIQGVAGTSSAEDRSPIAIGPLVQAFSDQAMEDGLSRASTHFEVPANHLGAAWEQKAADWAVESRFTQIIAADTPTGPARERLDKLEPLLSRSGIRLVRVRRAWDDALWPSATAGYFPFKEKLEGSLAKLGLMSKR